MTENSSNILGEDYLTRKQLASAFSKSERTISRWTHGPGGIPYIELGNEIYYRRDAVRAWLKAKETEPQRRAPRRGRQRQAA